MSEFRVIQVHQNIQAINDQIAENVRKKLKMDKTFMINLMACDVILISKIDTKTFFPFDEEKAVRRIHHLNPNAEIFFISAKEGLGMEQWIGWIKEQVKNWK